MGETHICVFASEERFLTPVLLMSVSLPLELSGKEDALFCFPLVHSPADVSECLASDACVYCIHG